MLEETDFIDLVNCTGWSMALSIKSFWVYVYVLTKVGQASSHVCIFCSYLSCESRNNIKNIKILWITILFLKIYVFWTYSLWCVFSFNENRIENTWRIKFFKSNVVQN